MQYVYVLNKHGEPLMPCSPGKARLLLKQQKACVVKRTPFTIKLLYGSAGYKQPITLGVDAGSKHVGLSASTEKRELYREEFTPRNDVVDLLSTRRQNRRSRRNRKTRYRAPRFDNRVHSKHKGWLAPSVELTHSHPLRSGILALCNKRWLEVFLRNRVEFTAVFELTLDLLNYGLSPFVQQFQ